jgi:hypothetical protein
LRVRAILPCLALLAALLLPAAASARESQFTMFEAPTELLSGDAGLRARTIDEIQGFGVRWLRVVLYWHGVAPVPDDPGVPRFDETDPDAYPGFARYDRLVREARARGMRILLTVSGPVPRWATRDRDDTVTRPSATRFGRFMTAVIRRYGDDVDSWSIWNEPNHPDFLRPQYAGSGRRRRAVSPGIYRDLGARGRRPLRRVPVRPAHDERRAQARLRGLPAAARRQARPHAHGALGPRPARDGRDARLDRVPRPRLQPLADAQARRTNGRGYWTTTTGAVRDRRYRVRWTDPGGTRWTGPLTRSYRSG